MSADATVAARRVRLAERGAGAAYVIGVDGGGTRTTVAIADAEGRELLRHSGPAGLVDPLRPEESAERLVRLLGEAVAAAGLGGPALALCAGLAGVGSVAERERVHAVLANSGVAERVRVVDDGAIALEGALGAEAGVLLISGTGSAAYGRGADGRVERCGGWGMVVGDEGSGFWIAKTAIQRALQAADGRREPTQLLPVLLAALEVERAEELPPRVARAAKAEIAALVPYVVALAEAGDAVAVELMDEAAADLALHAVALGRRLAPWPGAVPVVLWGGVIQNAGFAERVERALKREAAAFEVRGAAADAVTGALRMARAAVAP